VRQARKDLARIERRLERIGAEEEQLHARMAEVAADYAAVAELDERLRALGAERVALEEEWLEVAELAGA
ncbi:MAG TPA: ABC transporter ATP-binding protein, partial [Motilibacteraceae bacterium]|nr:ABC transporter ATP-binding protein [Motilibacteraceae bacterium]